MGEALIDRLEELIEHLAAIDPHDLPDSVLLESQGRLLRAERRLHGIGARRLQVMDARDVTTTECGRSTRAWLVEAQLLGRADADTRLQLARSMVTRPAIVEAMTAGEASQAQAGVIVNFLPRLDTPDAKDHAEKVLLDAAKFTDPTMLTRGLRQLRDALSLDESAEARAVRQHESRWLRFTPTYDEMTRQLHVTTDIDDLTRRIQAGDTCRSTVNGTPATPNTLRMLACDAGIIPVVMRGPSEILDLGRSTRTWSRAQRKAAKIRAGGHCEAPFCRAGLARCELHHEEEWASFGRTDLNNGIYLCTYHHWLVHHTDWVITRDKTTGQVEIRRT